MVNANAKISDPAEFFLGLCLYSIVPIGILPSIEPPKSSIHNLGKLQVILSEQSMEGSHAKLKVSALSTHLTSSFNIETF